MVGAPCAGICPDGVGDACTEFTATKHSNRHTVASAWYSEYFQTTNFALTKLYQAFGFGAAIGSDACLRNYQSTHLNDTPDPKRSFASLKFPTAESNSPRGDGVFPHFLCLIGSGAGAGLELSGGSHWN